MTIKEGNSPKRRYVMELDEEELEFLLACSSVAYSHRNEAHKEFFDRMKRALSGALPRDPDHVMRFWIQSPSSLETLVRPPAYRKDSE